MLATIAYLARGDERWSQLVGRSGQVRLILIRHAIACERSRDRWPRDADRPLSQRGIRRYRQAARGLGRLQLEPDLLLASPFLRTHQTAGILEDELGWPAPEMRGEFAVGAELGSAIKLLGGCAPHTTVAVVGHEPGMSRLTAVYATGSRSPWSLDWRRGSAALIEFPGSPRANAGTLRWFLPPRVLRALN